MLCSKDWPAFSVLQTKVGDELVRVKMWDTAGQEKFWALASSYYRDANIILIVYDITSRSSFKDANHGIMKSNFIVENPPDHCGCKQSEGN